MRPPGLLGTAFPHKVHISLYGSARRLVAVWWWLCEAVRPVGAWTEWVLMMCRKVSQSSLRVRRADRCKLQSTIALSAACAVVWFASVPAAPASAAAPVGSSDQGSAGQDPYEWLDGPVRCDRVEAGLRSRFSSFKPAELSTGKREEFRIVRQETCEAERYAQCSFSWCGDERIADRREAGRDGVDREHADRARAAEAVEDQILAALSDTETHLLRASVRTESARATAALPKAPAVPVNPTADLQNRPALDAVKAEAAPVATAEEKPVEVSPEQSARAMLESRPIVDADAAFVPPTAALAAEPEKRDALFSLTQVRQGSAAEATAEAELQRIVGERQRSQNEMIAKLSAEEESHGKEWQRVTVPGAVRAMRAAEAHSLMERQALSPQVAAQQANQTAIASAAGLKMRAIGPGGLGGMGAAPTAPLTAQGMTVGRSHAFTRGTDPRMPDGSAMAQNGQSVDDFQKTLFEAQAAQDRARRDAMRRQERAH